MNEGNKAAATFALTFGICAFLYFAGLEFDLFGLVLIFFPAFFISTIILNLISPEKKEIKKEVSKNVKSFEKKSEKVVSRNFVSDEEKKLDDWKRKEGVTDKDIILWNKLSKNEIEKILEQDDLVKSALFIDVVQKDGHVEGDKDVFESAAKKVRKYHPMFGVPDSEAKLKPNDAPLPIELKDRINRYIEARIKKDPEEYKKDIEKSSTFNALVRKEIKAGRL